MKSIASALLLPLMLGCSGNNDSTQVPDMAMLTLGAPPELALACNDAIADVYTLASSLPVMDATHRGDVFRCAKSESLTVADVEAQLAAYQSTSPNVTSGFWTWRVAFRTLRNTPGSGSLVEGDTPAVLLVPEKPLVGAPLVVWAHGSVGIAPKCAPSQLDLTAPPPDTDFPITLYKLAGYGYTVIAPDYSGFAYGQPPGYFNAEDEAHAMLDATRAAAQLLPTAPDKAAIVGHSQGGHAALAAHAYARSYGLHGTLIGVATLAPLWMSMSTWGAIPTDAAGLHTATDTSAILYSMEYNYSASILRGEDGLTGIFQPAKQQAAKDAMLGGECSDTARLTALGNKPSDFYDAAFLSDVGFNCAIVGDCTQGDAPKWLKRWKEDRPALDDQGGPILIWYGGMDMLVKPGYAQCARDKFAMDLSAAGATTVMSYCFDQSAGHRELVRGGDIDYVNQWIAARAGIGSDPAPCPAFPTGMTCATPPSNL